MTLLLALLLLLLLLLVLLLHLLLFLVFVRYTKKVRHRLGHVSEVTRNEGRILFVHMGGARNGND